MPKTQFCQAEGCEAEATETVPVSLSKAGDSKRHYCWTCAEVYHVGVQHGSLRENPNAYHNCVRTPAPIRALQRLVNRINYLPAKEQERLRLSKELRLAQAAIARHHVTRTKPNDR